MEVNQISDSSVSKNGTPCNVNDIVSEVTERNERSKNVRMHSWVIEDRVKDDLNKVMLVLIPIEFVLRHTTIFRLGASKLNSGRLLKIVYESGGEAKSILRSNKSNTDKQLRFCPDLTKLQENRTLPS